MIRQIRFILFLAILIGAVPVAAQIDRTAAPGWGVKVEERKLRSKLMGRDMPYRVILPREYATLKDSRYSVVFLLHGLTGHYSNWTDKTEIAKFAMAYDFIIVTPEGDDGWYTDSSSVPKDKYESYIVRELVPEIDSAFRTIAKRENRFIAGLSMGGYGALKFGLKYPDMFATVGSFSGALRATFWDDKNTGKWLSKSIMSVFGAVESETRKSNDIYRLASEVPAEKIKALPFIYLDCGTEDFLIENSHDFAKVLRDKKIPHEFRELPGKHDWVFWNSQVQEFLRLVERSAPKARSANAK